MRLQKLEHTAASMHSLLRSELESIRKVAEALVRGLAPMINPSPQLKHARGPCDPTSGCSCRCSRIKHLTGEHLAAPIVPPFFLPPPARAGGGAEGPGHFRRSRAAEGRYWWRRTGRHCGNGGEKRRRPADGWWRPEGPGQDIQHQPPAGRRPGVAG